MEADQKVLQLSGQTKPNDEYSRRWVA